MRTFTLWKCANASSTTIVIQSQRSPQGFQPFYIPNTCHSPAFFSRKLRANICTERKYLQCTSLSAICHIPPLTPNLIAGQRQDWQLASEQSGSRLCNRPSQGSLCLCLDYQRVHLNFNYPHLFWTHWLTGCLFRNGWCRVSTAWSRETTIQTITLNRWTSI